MLTLLLSVLSLFTLNASGGNFPPPLSKAEETRLFETLRRDGDHGERAKLIEHNLRLVSHIVRKYYASHGCDEDLISIGTIGLIKAVDSFDASKGSKFATYGAKCIQNEILMYFRAQKKTSREVSLSETIDTDRDGNELTYLDVIRVEDTIADDIDRAVRSERALRFVRTRLDERERKIIVLRYGLGGGEAMTQRKVAQLMGISRSYVSRIEKGALERLAEYLG